MSRKEFLIIAVLTFVTISAWVIFDILHTRSQSEIPPELQQVTQPITPDFDVSAVLDDD